MRQIVLSFVILLSTQAFSNSIWHVTGEQEFYLFGTIHVLRPDTYPLPQTYQDTLKQCDEFIFEVDLDELNDNNIVHQIQKIMLLPIGEKLKDQVSDSAYRQLEQLADEAGISLALLQGLKPWAAANQLTLMIFQQQGFTGEGLDMYLHAYAKNNNLPISGFETLLWQLNMFDELSNNNADDFVEFSTEDMDDVDAQVESLYSQWQQGDYETLYESAKFEAYPEVENAMLTNRNNAWMNVLLEPSSRTQCVAVGLLHMAGKHGLVEQFQAAGYQVTQLK
jgi:uncharacterized protein YbaP (TraB family)